eukprot:scaffold13470_cov116-Isochrysis_galbana.AAC.3
MLIAYPQSIWSDSDSGRNNKKTRKHHPPARRSAQLSRCSRTSSSAMPAALDALSPYARRGGPPGWASLANFARGPLGLASLSSHKVRRPPVLAGPPSSSSDSGSGSELSLSSSSTLQLL